jgi:hypothetical protein
MMLEKRSLGGRSSPEIAVRFTGTSSQHFTCTNKDNVFETGNSGRGPFGPERSGGRKPTPHQFPALKITTFDGIPSPSQAETVFEHPADSTPVLFTHTKKKTDLTSC